MLHPLLAELSQLEKDELLSLLIDGVKDIEDLISDSSGVYGLHLNGDGAEWDSLLSGGRFEEWLYNWDIGRVKLNELKKKNKMIVS